MDVTWVKRESIKRSEWFFYSFPEGVVEEPFLFPLLLYQWDDSFLILDGNKRLNLSFDEFPALYWTKEDLSPLEALVLSIKANETMRGLNSVEKGRILNIVYKFFPESLQEVSSLLGLGEREGKLLVKIDELDESLKLKIVQLKLPLKWVLKICEDVNGWNRVWSKVSDVKLSSSLLSKVIDSLWQLSHRENRSVDEIIEEWKEGTLIDFLDERRYPVSKDIQRRIDRLKIKYEKDQIEPIFPQHLEGETAMIVVTIRPQYEKEEVIKIVENILDDPDFKALMESL